LIFIEDHYTGRRSPSVGALTIAADLRCTRARKPLVERGTASRVVQITIDTRALKKCIRATRAHQAASRPADSPPRMSRSVLLGSP
jgi:hypothetical protein